MSKFKKFLDSEKGKNFFIILIVILVGTGSFGLGRLSKDESMAGITVTYPEQTGNVLGASDTIPASAQATLEAPKITPKASTTVGSTSAAGKPFFASKIGHKYYSIGCSGGKTIKQENRIYFSTATEAEAAGFTKSTSCK
ncbi:MAG: hypothetical protein WDN09_03450 [bacterium]